MALVDERIRDILDSRDIDRLIKLVFDASVPDDERPRAVQRALWELEGLGYSGLTELAVRASVELPKEVSDEARNWFLDKWIEGDGFGQRETVLRLLGEGLDREEGDRLVQAIRAVQFIGYRDDALVQRLESLSGLEGPGVVDDRVEAWALTALARMGYPEPKRITQRLQARLDKNGGFDEADCWTAFYHADAGMLSALFDAVSWERPALEAVALLAEREPELGPEIWKRFVRGEDAEYWLNQGRMAKAIDRPEVGRTLVEEALDALRHHESRNTLMPMDRLIGAYREQVIEGAKQRSESLTEEELEWIRRPAVQLDSLNLRVMTSEGYDKDAAWKILLHLGHRKAKEWLKDAVGESPSRSDLTYADYAGYLRQGDVVPALAQAVCAKDVDHGYGLQIIEALGIIGTEEALRALLRSEVWFRDKDEGGIPEKLVDAIVSAAMTLGSDDLVWAALNDRRRHETVRLTCAYALQRLARLRYAPKPRIAQIRSLVERRRTAQPGWKPLLILLAECDPDGETLELLRQFEREFKANDDIAEALARSGILREYPDRLERLGLVHEGDEWRAHKDLGRFENFILLLLYKADPSFEKSIMDVLDYATYSTAGNILYNLHREDRVSPKLADTLVNRLVDDKGGPFSGGGTLEAIGNVAPNRLIDKRLREKVEGWSSENLAEYVEQLRESRSGIDDKDALARIGTQYLRDDDAEVRRQAARLLGAVSVEQLFEATTRMMSEAVRLDEWVYAIQAARYLGHVPDGWTQIRDTHREPMVRLAMRQTIEEVERAALARRYTARVLAEEDVLQAWAYGDALLKIGDEISAEVLLEGLPEQVYRRAYLIGLSKKIKKAAEEHRKKLDERLVLPPPGNQETPVSVYFIDQSEEPFAATLIERRRTGNRRRVPLSWRLEFVGVPAPLAKNATADRFQIRVVDDDGESGTALVRKGTETEGGRYAIVGRGMLG